MPKQPEMTESEAKERIRRLRETIDKHRYAYHVEDKATISEAALDSLKHELYELEQVFPKLITSDSPTQRVGGKPLAKFKKVSHARPMLSMEDVFSLEEYEAWMRRVLERSGTKRLDVFCMPKVDGLAISLVYEDGALKTGATRGDGKVGEDVTANIKTIESIPLSLREIKGKKMPKTVEVRGEVYFPLSAFAKFNKKLEKEGMEPLANPRNAAAGSIRQLDPKVTAERKLAFFAWDLFGDFGQETQEEEWDILTRLGFHPTPESAVCKDTDAARKRFDALRKKREKLDYWIDGLVVRVNDTKAFERLGVVGKTPRGLIAWKYPAEEGTAKIKDIEWFVGRTGALTPVAVLEPTLLGGTTVQNASLHNLDEIRRLDARVGDTVILYKAGDIIPKVKEVLKDLRPKGTHETNAPRKCPVCGSKAERREGEVAIYCSNPNCFAQDRENVLYAARAFGIDGIGPSTVAALLEHKLIGRAPDLFGLKPDDVAALEGFGAVSAGKLVDEIQAQKEIGLANFLVALGVRNVGAQTAIDLADHFGSLDRIRKATDEELKDVADVGQIVAESLQEFFGSERGASLIKAYEENGIRIKNPPKRRTDTPFSGKTVVLTGTLEAMGRDDAEDAIRQAGGKASGSVSKKTDFVIVGENAGSKADKAKKLGVTILSEKDFLRNLR